VGSVRRRSVRAADPREGQAAVDLEETGVRVMTIHAAKGLEFPVVCLVDADRNFNIGGTERILKDQQLGLGFTVSVRKAKGPGYQDVPTTGRRKMLERSRSRSIAEEKRLLYVACTRARDHLLISGVDRAAAPDRGSFRDWLVNEGEKVPGLTVTESDNLMQLTSAAGTVELPLYRDPDAVYGAGAEVARTLDVLKQAIRLIEQAPQQKVPLPPALKRALERRPVRPGIDRHSTYQLITYKECPRKFEYRYLYAIPEWTLFDRGSDDMSEALRKTSRHALNFGRLCHRVFEALPHVGAEAVDDLITRLCREEQVDEIEYHKELRDVVDRARNSVLWSKIFGEQGESEVPFSLDLDKRVVEGVIDRTREGDTLEVFDYKTTKVLDKKGKVDARIVDQVVTNHRVQMQVYAAGVAKAHGVLPEKVEAMLFFTDLPNDPKRIDVSQADRAIAETVNQIAESLANDHFPPAPLKEKESRESHCRKCGYWQHRICSERRAGKSIK
jgi:ATP-dependent exoDNAse (exonuclease V) beta subunit